MSMWLWSGSANQMVLVDEDDEGVDHCENCGAEIVNGEVLFDDGEAFCQPCWVTIFGEG